MKANNLAVLFSLAALLPLAASAKSPEQAYLESCRKDLGVPIPIVVVSPHVESGFAGKEVDVEFTVDATGKPFGFNVKSSVDITLANAVVDALKQWQFAPAHREGVPVAMKVALPVRILSEFETGTHYVVE